MKFLLLGVFVFFFGALPMWVLDTLVMPNLQQLQSTYAHANDIANKAAGLAAEH